MSFQPYAVQCPTCGSRLRVTDPAVIGTIAACPKCQSMVQIDSPAADTFDSGSAGTDSPAAGRDTTPTVPPSQPAQLRVGASSIDSEAITEEAVRPGELDSPLAGNHDSSIKRDFSGDENFAPPVEPPGTALPVEWESDRTRQTRQIALVALLSISALLVAGLAFAWFAHSYRNRSVADTSDPGTELAQSDTTTDPIVGPEPNLDDPLDPKEPVVETESQAGTTDQPLTDQPLTDPNSDVPVEPELASSNAPPSIIPTDLMPTSPIDSAPIGNDPVPIKPIIAGDRNKDPTKQETDPDASQLMDLPPGLAQYIPFLASNGPADNATLKAPPTLDEVEIDEATEDDLDPLDRYEPRKLNLKSDMAIPLPFRSNGYPLADMILVISQITGVPIQIDWVSFDLVGIDVATQIKPPKSAGSARQVLDEIAIQVGGTIREEETLLHFTIADEPFNEALTKITNVDDFGDGAQSAREVLADFLRPEPEPLEANEVTESNDGAENEIEPDAEAVDPTKLRQSQQLAAIATETLRRMRGVTPKVADDRLSHWARTSVDQPSDWPIIQDGEPGVQPDTPVSIAGFLRRAARNNQASCLVNWYDANRRRAMPERQLLPDTSDGLSAMLKQALEPMGLHVRQVDARHWWVGSDASYDRLSVIVASRPLGEKRIVFVQQVQRIMAGSNRNDFRMTIDDESDRAIMMLPRYVVRQLAKVAK
ncbi:hypothetical protein [Rubripirellula reticaptiva]|uniref:Uncharacterized protein n=1 Tax=Rubripirellula reticaptiva TaxID=2528013 RepID=A0A5C6FAM0_9BACT|nr:hypothetical protein [Rubripirellula reticaptiva]TWU57567.1 hypothetical protein Poly59_04740 [Rubripirellula reticaptiva]